MVCWKIRTYVDLRVFLGPKTTFWAYMGSFERSKKSMCVIWAFIIAALIASQEKAALCIAIFVSFLTITVYGGWFYETESKLREAAESAHRRLQEITRELDEARREVMRLREDREKMRKAVEEHCS